MMKAVISRIACGITAFLVAFLRQIELFTISLLTQNASAVYNVNNLHHRKVVNTEDYDDVSIL